MSIGWLLSVIINLLTEFGPMVSISIFVAGLIWEYHRPARYVSNGLHGFMKVKDGLPIGVFAMIFASIMFIMCVLLATGFLEWKVPDGFA